MTARGGEFDESEAEAVARPERGLTPAAPRRGALMLTVGTVASGLLAYAFNVFAARTLGPADYGPIAVLWAALFLVSVCLFRPVEQTLSRGIAERAALGLDARPVLEAAGRLAAVITAVATLAVILAWEPLSQRLFDGHELFVAAFAVGIGGYAVSFVVRGVAGGLEWFDGYGVLLLADGAIRLGLALPLVITGSPAVAAVAIAAAAIGGAVAPFAPVPGLRRAIHRPMIRERLRGRPAPPFALGHALRLAAPIGVIAAADQILVSGGALLIALSGGAGASAAAGTVFAATMLVRAPVFLFQGFAAALLPSLTRMRAIGDETGFRRYVSGSLGALLVFGVALTGGTLLLGPESMRLLFGAGFEVGRGDLTLLAAGVSGYLAAATLSQAAIARAITSRAAGIWSLSASWFVALELLLDGSPLHRVSVAFSTAAFLGAALFAFLILVLPEPDRRPLRAEPAATQAAHA